MTLGDFITPKPEHVDPFMHEVGVMKQLILERTHQLELLRELISNSGAVEVRSKNIWITYFVHPQYGHVFEVRDDGCGMNFTNSSEFPGRLDRFLGLGLSAVAGLDADEFAWKGIGSKLSYHSRRVEVETFNGNKAYQTVVNEPWKTIETKQKPRPVVTEIPAPWGAMTGTKVIVFGHPPYRKAPFKFEEIYDYLVHRTFVGFTRLRENPPKVFLNVQGREESLDFGFPEIRTKPDEPPEGTVIVDPPIQISKNLPGTNRSIQLRLNGFYTWDERNYNLADVHYNTGMILSVKGIPYFTLDMRELGSGQLAVANPGPSKCCLIVECDSIQSEMNISRSSLVDSEMSEHFKRLVGEAIKQVEDSDRHRAFRLVPKKRKDKEGASGLLKRKQALERSEQGWVYYQSKDMDKPIRLLRQPENETDTLAILWKLEALNALPFSNFETLSYSGTGADLVVHFQEDESSNPERFTTMEVEYRFFNYKQHGHLITQFPTVICWDINPKPKLSVGQTAKPFKYIVQLKETTLRIYALSRMPNIFVATEEDMKRNKANEAWGSNL
ncbi:MAG: ATP-binding protein [Anaerolineales bacterium]|nr:ATP-binding protein [Anaerolineales bacterium]